MRENTRWSRKRAPAVCTSTRPDLAIFVSLKRGLRNRSLPRGRWRAAISAEVLDTDELAAGLRRSVRGAKKSRALLDLRGPVMSAESQSVILATARYVLLPLANLITGYTVKAMERKIERGDWQEGKVWKRAPDGRILIDMVGYQKWVESQ